MYMPSFDLKETNYLLRQLKSKIERHTKKGDDISKFTDILKIIEKLEFYKSKLG